MNSMVPERYIAKKNSPLSDRSTLENLEMSDKELKKELKEVRSELGALQDIFYAHDTYSVLICLQGMDTAGKDSLIREVFKDFNASGLEVHSFKVPTDLELSHNYLWRHYLVLPPKGKFGVFNRTHYENVLVTRVHPEYILKEKIPGIDSVKNVDQKFWNKRFDEINNFEKSLVDNGTIIFKFFLHLSKEEQRNRLLRRLAIQEKHWKFSPGDLKERKLWDTYQKCYAEAIEKTNTTHSPWYIIPADNKKAARVLVASILLEQLKKYKEVSPPELDDKIAAHLGTYQKELENE